MPGSLPYLTPVLALDTPLILLGYSLFLISRPCGRMEASRQL